MEKQNKKTEKKEIIVDETSCTDRDCPIHGELKVRGKAFEGKVIRKFDKRVTIEFERMVYVHKYERYARMRTRIHSRLPHCMKKQIELGDLIRVQECRPLSKITHSVVMKKIKSGEEKQ